MLVSALLTALYFHPSNAHFFPIHMDCQTLEIVIYDYFQINCIHLEDLVSSTTLNYWTDLSLSLSRRVSV